MNTMNGANGANPIHDLAASARQALACLDLTSLNDADTAVEVAALCRRATGPHGNVAAVCVWPRFVKLARAELPPGIAVAAVANFPEGANDTARAVRDAAEIVNGGGQEVDVVMPWRQLAAAPKLLAAVRVVCKDLKLKVILEAGEIKDPALMAQASRIALDAGADFLKTSTGRTPNGANIAAATVMLQAISAGDEKVRSRVGFKAAGGVRTVADAASYMALAAQHLGAAAVTPARFRIGASGLLNDIEAVLAGSARPAAGSSY
jgi:deoxyribose-phosphate aldolase